MNSEYKIMFKNTFLPLSLFIVALASLVVFYLTGNAFYSHSDALYLPVLFSDIIDNNGEISDWYLTPAPYFFPDYFIFLLAYFLGFDTYNRLLVFCILQVSLTFFSIWVLVSQVSKNNSLLLSSLATILLIWLALVADQPFVFLLISAHHYGGFISAMLFVSLWLRYSNIDESEESGSIMLIMGIMGMSLLSFIASLSDSLFIVETLVPFFFATVFFKIIDKEFSKKNIFIIYPVLSGVVGYFSYNSFVEHQTRYISDIGLNKLATNFFEIISMIHISLNKAPLYRMIFFGYLLIGIILILLRIALKFSLLENRKLNWLYFFSFLSLLSTLSVMCITTNIDVTLRYLISALSWPVIVMVLFVAHFSNKRFYYLGLCLSIAFTITLSKNALTLAIKSQGVSLSFYPEQINCIDNAINERGLRNGIAQYWDAKYIQAFTSLKINLAQHIENLEEHRWVTSSKFYKKNYDFAIISENAEPPYKISFQKLTEINGEPSGIVICGDKKILIYGQGKLRVRKIVSPGDSYRWKACELPTVIGSRTIACQTEKTDTSQSGYLTFGPYEALPSGKYFFEIEYLSSKDISDIAGVWDVVIALPNKAEIIANGDLPGTCNKINKISGFFTLEQKYNMDRIEIRTLAYKDGVMRLDYLTVKRLE